MKGARVRANRTALILGLAALIAPHLAVPGMAQTWSITIAPGGSVLATNLKRTPPNSITGTTATAQVNCQTASDCANVGLQLEKNGAVVMTLGRSPAGSDTFPVPASAVQGTVMDLAVTFQGQKIDSYPVTAGASGSSGGSTGSTTTPGGTPGTPAQPASVGGTPLAEMLATTCPEETVSLHYDAKANLGEILVTPAGNVLARAVDTFDENDKLRVIVYGDARLLPLLKVQRTSAFGVQTVRIAGAGLTVPELVARQAAGVCTTAEFMVSDFSPGQATVQMSALQGTTWLPLGSFDFEVDPLYTGILSLGAAWTDLVDPGFKIASNGSGTVIALGESGKHDLLYTLLYTPYVWGRRNLDRKIPTRQWYKHVNPSIGIAPQNLDENAFVGITIDLPAGFLFTFGRHFRQVATLPASSGLTVGSPFTGTADQLPTTQSWKNDNFFAVTVDLRAIVQLFAAAGAR
jgi:hypothetical protein